MNDFDEDELKVNRGQEPGDDEASANRQSAPGIGEDAHDTRQDEASLESKKPRSRSLTRGLIAIALVFVVAVALVGLTSGSQLLGTLSSDAPQGDPANQPEASMPEAEQPEMPTVEPAVPEPSAVQKAYTLPRVTDPSTVLGKISVDHKTERFVFDKDHEYLDNPVSHAQGYARFRSSAGIYHLVPYSNVAGEYGFIYCVSDETDGTGTASYDFTMRVPMEVTRHNEVAYEPSEYNPTFNHPCGFQVFGNYLVVSIIPYHTANSRFYDSALIYLYDLSSLAQANPSIPTRYTEILRVPKVNGGSLSCAGLVDLNDGRYALGLIADNNLDIYISENAPFDAWEVSFGGSPDYSYALKAKEGDNHYQGMGFFLDTNEEVYVLGFDTRNSNEDWADLYKLTSSREWEPSSTLNPINTIHLTGGDGARFRYGGGFEPLDYSSMVIYSNEQYYTNGGIRINRFDQVK